MDTQMFSATPSGAARSERSFCLAGVHDREALVFKSMVRLLSHRTKHIWIYSPLSTELRVVAEGPPSAATHTVPAQQVLTLGTVHTRRTAYLQLPLHAHELEAELNRLGALILPAISTATLSADTQGESAPMRMLRWPPATVVNTATRMRLATLMAGKPLTILELQQRSKENLAVCTAFFDDLKRHHLLVPVPNAAGNTAIAATAAAQSIVRSTVAGAITGPPSMPAQILPEKKSPVLPGLLGRIRMRLGISLGESSNRVNRA